MTYYQVAMFMSNFSFDDFVHPFEDALSRFDDALSALRREKADEKDYEVLVLIREAGERVNFESEPMEGLESLCPEGTVATKVCKDGVCVVRCLAPST